MSVTKHDVSVARRRRRACSYALAALLGACSSSEVDDQTSFEMATSDTQMPTKPAGSSSSASGGMSVVDAGTKSGGTSTTMTSPMTSNAGQTAAEEAGSGATNSTSGVATAGMSGSPSVMDAGMSEISGADAGSQMTVDDEDAGMECMPPKRPLRFGSAPKCSMDLCPAQDSICLPEIQLGNFVPRSTIDLLARCNDKDVCVPVALAETGGKSLLPKCKSLNGAEGRCISSCVPLVATQASLLPKDVCEGEDLCAPCFDPRTGEDTLACRQGCDSGPTEPPKAFDKCCAERGLCVPPELAGDQVKNLDQQTCAAGTLCAPTELTDPTFKPKSCDSIDGAEGRCISTCAGGAVAKQKDRLPTAGCEQDEVCAPCYDPITGEDTGACTLNGDKPVNPKYTFQECCGSTGTNPVGVCVPPALAGEQAGILRQESCPEGKLCAPVQKAADPAFEFTDCRGLLGAGVCVNACIVDPTQAALLSRSGCESAELCAPCDLLGSPTGACL